MRFRPLLAIWASILMLLCCIGCEHRPLEDSNERRFVRVYLDEHIKNVSYGFYDKERQETEYTTPRILRIAFYNPLSGKQVYEGYLQHVGNDERGNYVEGFIPAFEGIYRMLVSRFDNTSTHLREEHVYHNAQVYTKPVADEIMHSLSSANNASHSGENIVNQPNHFFVISDNSITLNKSVAIDTLRKTNGRFFTAKSVTKTYYLQINIKGAEYVSSASGYLTGLAGSVHLADQTLNEEDKSCIYFPLKSNHLGKRSEVSQAFTTFNTFGKIPKADGTLSVVFEFKTTYGTIQVEKIDLNDLFETEMVKNEQWIIIDKVIEIKPDESGSGMQPSVGSWGTVEGNITI